MCTQIQIILISLLLLTGCSGAVPKLGIDNGQLSPCSSKPNCVNSQATDEKHYIDPIVTSETSSEVKKHILEILNKFRNTTIIETENNYIRAEFTSTVFHFVDDVEFYFPDIESKEMIIYARSASRIGYSDLGVNRKRIEKIRSKLKIISKVKIDKKG